MTRESNRVNLRWKLDPGRPDARASTNLKARGIAVDVLPVDFSFDKGDLGGTP